MEYLIVNRRESDNSIDTSVYTIGLIVEPNGIMRKHILIKQILSEVLSPLDESLKYKTRHVILALRNPYEHTIARQLIELRRTSRNLTIEVLVSNSQMNKFQKWRNSRQRCSYADIIEYADFHTALHTIFPTDYFRLLARELALRSNKIVYSINHRWEVTLLQSYIII